MTGEVKESGAQNSSQLMDETRAVVIADYDPRWPVLFEEEKTKILAAIGHMVISIEHIGSTSVPGLGAKPIIDMMIAVSHISDANGCFWPLHSLGYHYIIKHEVVMPRRRFFRKGRRDAGTHHIHMVEPGSEFWERHLLFRDHLRAHPEESRRYFELKKRLAKAYGSDRGGYTDAKTPFIEAVTEKARIEKRLITAS